MNMIMIVIGGVIGLSAFTVASGLGLYKLIDHLIETNRI